MGDKAVLLFLLLELEELESVGTISHYPLENLIDFYHRVATLQVLNIPFVLPLSRIEIHIMCQLLPRRLLQMVADIIIPSWDGAMSCWTCTFLARLAESL